MRSYRKNIKLFRLRLKTYKKINALAVYNGMHIKTKIITYCGKAYTNFPLLNHIQSGGKKNNNINALAIYDGIYRETKIITYGGKVYTYFLFLNPNQTGAGAKQPPRYILLYNFLVTHPNSMKFGDFS